MFDALRSWWNAPYSDSMSAARWFLFVGFILVVLTAWAMIVRILRD